MAGKRDSTGQAAKGAGNVRAEKLAALVRYLARRAAEADHEEDRPRPSEESESR
jgi:hypothetical protein